MTSVLPDDGALRGLRVGCVRYLNARPLIEPYGGPVVLEHPALLAASLARGELDVALVPVFEALRSPECPIVDGVSISSQGPVWSVFVAHKGPVAAIKEVVLDPASLTSANLCKLLFAEWGASVPAYLPESPAPAWDADTARLLIGNQAIAFRETHGAAFEYLDFGEEWKRRTGLPFVYAIWLMRPGLPQPERVAEALRGIACRGLATVSEIAARYEAEHPPGFALRYLTEHIRFGLGDAEKQGMARFRQLLIAHGQLSFTEGAIPLRFV